MRKAWTDEEKTRFCYLWQQGAKMRAIAEELGRTEGYLRVARYKMGLAPRQSRIWRTGKPWSEQEVAKLCRLVRAGFLVVEIAEELGRSKRSILQRIYSCQLRHFFRPSLEEISDSGRTP